MRSVTGRLIALALFMSAGMLVVAAGGAVGQPGKDKEPGKEKKDKDKKGKADKDDLKGGAEKNAKEIRKAFEGLTEAAQAPPTGKDAPRLLDHAKAFYRAAVKAYADDPRRSRELALAANDAARGLGHLRRASYQPVSDLPEPPTEVEGSPTPKDDPKDKDGPKGKGKDDPKGKGELKGRDKDGPKGKGAPPPPKDDDPKGKDGPPPKGGPAERGPWTPALDALTDVQDQLSGATPPAKGPGRDFFDAAKSVYRQARTAYEAADYRKARELARAADAWLRVGEHLGRAEWDGPAPPPAAPEPKKKGAPPLPPIKD